MDRRLTSFTKFVLTEHLHETTISRKLTSAKVLLHQPNVGYSSHGECEDVCGDADAPAELDQIDDSPLSARQPFHHGLDHLLGLGAGTPVWFHPSVGIHARRMLEPRCPVVSYHYRQHSKRRRALLSFRACAVEAQYGPIAARHYGWPFCHTDSVCHTVVRENIPDLDPGFPLQRWPNWLCWPPHYALKTKQVWPVLSYRSRYEH